VPGHNKTNDDNEITPPGRMDPDNQEIVSASRRISRAQHRACSFLLCPPFCQSLETFRTKTEENRAPLERGCLSPAVTKQLQGRAITPSLATSPSKAQRHAKLAPTRYRRAGKRDNHITLTGFDSLDKLHEPAATFESTKQSNKIHNIAAPINPLPAYPTLFEHASNHPSLSTPTCVECNTT